jgi:transposase, IS5 family
VLLPDGTSCGPSGCDESTRCWRTRPSFTPWPARGARWPQSHRRGRPGTPADVVLRMLVLKHLFDWSYDDLEREVRANLVYRAFTRIDTGEVPDAKTSLKIARVGPDAIQQLHQRIVELAKRARVTRGRRFRIDTTVVETNVRYPTDSSLLQDASAS